jgi:MFS family permease
VTTHGGLQPGRPGGEVRRCLVWVFYPVFLYQQGFGLGAIGWVVGISGLVWGGSHFVTGRLSDHVGRLKPIVWGMWLCGGGVALTLLGTGVVWWSFSAAVTGFGMALLYPNLSAAVADIPTPTGAAPPSVSTASGVTSVMESGPFVSVWWPISSAPLPPASGSWPSSCFSRAHW